MSCSEVLVLFAKTGTERQDLNLSCTTAQDPGEQEQTLTGQGRYP